MQTLGLLRLVPERPLLFRVVPLPLGSLHMGVPSGGALLLEVEEPTFTTARKRSRLWGQLASGNSQP